MEAISVRSRGECQMWFAQNGKEGKEGVETPTTNGWKPNYVCRAKTDTMQCM